MIDAYPRDPTVLPGETLAFHLSTDAPSFRVKFYRYGAKVTEQGTSADYKGQGLVNPGSYDKPWGWPSFDFHVPVTWPSGPYVAVLIEVNGGNETLPKNSTYAWGPGRFFFVVGPNKSHERRRILFNLPYFTYHAYNHDGGGSFYLTPKGEPMPMVTWHRTGGGTMSTAGFPVEQDHQDGDPAHGIGNTFAHWDAPFVQWMERQGYAVDYCTDLDIHRSPNLLDNYLLLLSGAHDEYWSQAMRDHITRFVRSGGRFANFGGNTCWWKIDVDTKNLTQTKLGKWWMLGDAENSLLGTSYRNGGGWWSAPRTPLGYHVERKDHWAFRGTDVATKNVQVFGADDRLIGYECDGSLFDDQVAPAKAKAGLGQNAPPPGFEILALARISSPPWDDLPPREDAGFKMGLHAATMGIYCHENGGAVFTAATVDWSRVLSSGKSPTDVAIVRGITRNVIDQFSAEVAIELGGPKVCGAPFPPQPGAVVECGVVLGPLQKRPGVKIRWASSGTIESGGDKVVCRINVGRTSPLLVAVSVYTDDECPIAGARLSLPLLAGDGFAAWLIAAILQCMMRRIGQLAVMPVPTVVPGVREGHRLMVDPLWDPVPHHFSPGQLAELITRSQDLLQWARRLDTRSQRLRVRHLAGGDGRAMMERCSCDGDVHTPIVSPEGIAGRTPISAQAPPATVILPGATSSEIAEILRFATEAGLVSLPGAAMEGRPAASAPALPEPLRYG